MTTPAYENDRGVTLIEPSADPTGQENLARINATFSVARRTRLSPGRWIIPNTINLPWTNILHGSGRSTVIYPLFDGNIIRQYNQQTASGNYATQENYSGGIRDLMIDGSLTPGVFPSYAYHFGDMLGPTIKDVYIRNFTTSGSSGIFCEDSIWWTEKVSMRATVSNCATCFYFLNTGGTASLEYSLYDLVAYWTTGQTAIACNVTGGANVLFWGGTDNYWRGECNGPSPGPFLSLEGGIQFKRCRGFVCPENNSGSGTPPITIADLGGGTNKFVNTMMDFDFGANAWSPTTLAAGNFQTTGSVQGDNTLKALRTGVTPPAVSAPGLPLANNTVTNNFGVDCFVYIPNNGVGVNVTVAGNPTGLGFGTFHVRMGSTIGLGAYSTAPGGWVWNAGTYP